MKILFLKQWGNEDWSLFEVVKNVHRGFGELFLVFDWCWDVEGGSTGSNKDINLRLFLSTVNKLEMKMFEACWFGKQELVQNFAAERDMKSETEEQSTAVQIFLKFFEASKVQAVVWFVVITASFTAFTLLWTLKK
jgi:hypothetical protein